MLEKLPDALEQKLCLRRGRPSPAGGKPDLYIEAGIVGVEEILGGGGVDAFGVRFHADADFVEPLPFYASVGCCGLDVVGVVGDEVAAESDGQEAEESQQDFPHLLGIGYL